MKLKGKYRFINHVTLPGGQTKTLSCSKWIENMILTNGESTILNAIKNSILGMGVGTSDTEPAKGNTSLTGAVRIAVETSTVDTGDKTVTFKSTFTAAQINDKKEIGLYTTATTGGTLATRSVFSAISIPAGSNMSVEYVLTLTA